MKQQIVKLIPVVAVAVMFTACQRPGKDKTGSIYMPDMTYSNAYETYSSAPKDLSEGGTGLSARKPVEGTIPYGYIPNDSKIKTNQSYLMSYVIKNHYTHDPAKWQEEFDRAGKEISNPLEATEANLAEGKRIYNINCSPCHGEGGDGNGQLVELPNGDAGPFTSRPNPYKTRLPEINDGNMFYVVSYGKNMMGGYGFQLSVNERWQVIHYIKKMAGIGTTTTAVADSTSKK